MIKKFEKVTVQNDAFLNFLGNEEKRTGNIFKNVVNSKLMLMSKKNAEVCKTSLN